MPFVHEARPAVKRVIHDVEERLVAALHAIAEASAAAPDLPALVAHLHPAIGSVLPCEGLLLAIRESDGRLGCHHHGPSLSDATWRAIALQALEGNRPLSGTTDGVVWVAVPLRERETALGVLVAHGSAAQAGADVLGLVAEPVATAIVRARAVTEVREAEAKFRAFMRNLPGSAYIKDAGGHHVFANEALERLLGLAPGAVLGHRLEDLVPGVGSRCATSSRPCARSGTASRC